MREAASNKEIETLRWELEHFVCEGQYEDGLIRILESYLGNVNSTTQRAGEECPDTLKPLVALQYRGTIWTQKNGRDWTARAFLVNDEEGLSLDVAEHRLTLQAMQGALRQLAVTPAASAVAGKLRGGHLEGDFCPETAESGESLSSGLALFKG